MAVKVVLAEISPRNTWQLLWTEDPSFSLPFHIQTSIDWFTPLQMREGGTHELQFCTPSQGVTSAGVFGDETAITKDRVGATFTYLDRSWHLRQWKAISPPRLQSQQSFSKNFLKLPSRGDQKLKKSRNLLCVFILKYFSFPFPWFLPMFLIQKALWG